jgi:hypothetical protein
VSDNDDETQRRIDEQRRRMHSPASALARVLPLIMLWGGGHFSSRETKAHNVTECCQCGATIGRGRDGRRCKACREKDVDDLSDVALPYGFGGKPVVEVRIPGEVQQ